MDKLELCSVNCEEHILFFMGEHLSGKELRCV